MNFKTLSAFFVVLVTLLIYGDGVGAAKSEDIKKKITGQNAYKYVGIGGRYGRLANTVSKHNVIESDHFQPKSAYYYAKDKTIKAIKERDMAAVSIPYAKHKDLLTTGRANVKGGFMNQWLYDDFKAGNYNEAITKNIQLYVEAKFLDQIKKGVMDALLVHQANGLITNAQRKALITKFKLDSFDKNIEKDKDRIEAVKVVQYRREVHNGYYMDGNKRPIKKIKTTDKK